MDNAGLDKNQILQKPFHLSRLLNAIKETNNLPLNQSYLSSKLIQVYTEDVSDKKIQKQNVSKRTFNIFI
jgi:hypothetical protein